jgi:hypothetical protein
METEVIEPELIPVIFTLLATPFAVAPESANVIFAPPVAGQLDKEEVGYTKLSMLTTMYTGLALTLVKVITSVFVPEV